MKKTVKDSRLWKYCAVVFTSLALFLYSLFFSPIALPDIVIVFIFYGFLLFYDHYYELSRESFILVLVTGLLNPIGVFGMYSHFILPIVGYDKFIHLFSTFAIAYIMSESLPGKEASHYIIIILAVLGLSSIIEINEFIGYRYFNVDNGGIFTMYDTLPVVKSDLQKFDTYYDLIFNLCGASLGTLAWLFQNKYFPKRK